MCDMETKPTDPGEGSRVFTPPVARLILVYLLIPCILFLCAGDVGWWQTWVYSLLVFAASIGGRMLAERRHPGLLAERVSYERSGRATMG